MRLTAMIVFRFLQQSIQFAGIQVGLQLAIPRGRIELGKPAPELGEGRWIQRLHGSLQRLDVSHVPVRRCDLPGFWLN